MKTTRRAIPEGQDSIFPLRGLNTRDQSTLIPPQFSPELNNMMLVKGRARSRRGYQQLGPQLYKNNDAAQPVTDPVVLATIFESINGTKFFVVSTIKRQFRYDSSGSGSWVDITMKKVTFKYTNKVGTFSPGELVTQTTSAATGTFLSDDGTYIYLSLVSGTFTSTSGHGLTGQTSEAIADPNASTATAYVELTGTLADGMDFVIGADNNGKYIYISNGVDRPRRWDGSIGTFEDCRFNLDGLLKAKSLAIFAGSMVLGNLTTTEGAAPQSIAWSDTSNFGDFNSGNFGAQLLPDIKGSVQKLLILGDRLAIYGDDSISLTTFIGGGAIFSTEQVVQDTSLLGPRAIANIGAFHLFASRNDIMMFDGSRQLRNYGDLIAQSYSTDIALDQASRAFIFYDAPWERVYVSIPTDASLNRSYVAQLDFNDIASVAWTKEYYNDVMATMGFYQIGSSLLWNSASLSGVTWAQMGQTWDERSNRTDFKTKVLGGAGKVYLFDTVLGDNGASVDAWWDTKDFVIPGEYRSSLARWLEFEVEIKGSSTGSVTFWYSTDQGKTYTQVSNTDKDGVDFTVATGVLALPDSAWNKFKLFVDVVSDSIRLQVRITGTTNYAEFRHIRAWFIPSGRNL